MRIKIIKLIGSILCLVIGTCQIIAQGFEGYYQYPDIHGNTVVFTAEGDLWEVSVKGGVAQRLTTHAEQEYFPSISPDGKTIAYAATYEGPTEVYTLPVGGGIPTRWTYSSGSYPVSWTSRGKMVYRTGDYNKLPYAQLVTVEVESNQRERIPLHQAYEGIQNEEGTWFFVPFSAINDHVKRYVGGLSRQIWKFDGKNEAIKLTTDHLGESYNPMWYGGRVYFITDRDGMKNIWSMDADGKDLKQHTQHDEFDVRTANVDDGKIVYQHGPDLWLLDLTSNTYKKLDIRLATDLPQLREKWIDNPSPYITAVHPDPKGEKVVVTARGRAFVVPVKGGRTVAFTDQGEVRYRDAVFSHDGKNVITLSDESGEFEFVQFAADGYGEKRPLTDNGYVLRYRGIPSPNGKWIAYDDKDNNMYVLNMVTGTSKKISDNRRGIRDFSWSPDSRWVAFVERALMNGVEQIKVYNLDDESIFDLTTDRYNSYNPCWSPGGEFIYFLSDRTFSRMVGSPAGIRREGPYWDKSERIYHVSLKKGTRSPFREKDELMDEGKKETPDAKEEELVVEIDKEGIQSRIIEVPIGPGNYRNLAVNDQAVFLIESETGHHAKSHLKAVKITNEDIGLTTIASEVNSFEMTQNGKKLLVRKGRSYYMVNAGTGSVKLDDGKIDLSACKFSLRPQEEWKQIYKDSWRLERDYFYDKNMHGVDWDAMYEKYLPLVDRVTTRNELNDVIARLTGELSALHTGSSGGDIRSDKKYIGVPNLGANLSRDEANGGYRIDYIYKVDPDLPGYPYGKSPLDDPFLDIREGDIITQVNGRDVLSTMDIGELFRNQAGKQVRLSLKRGSAARDVIVKPKGNYFWTRYGDWEYSNRLKVEARSDHQIGYLHLSAMSDWDLGQFYREFYPAIHKKGIIVDVRYNAGGNIDAYILEKLLNKVWMYWAGRWEGPTWGMPYAFKGHLVVLINEQTGSNGETFAEGFKRLELGPAIGKRTWGGQIWVGSRPLTDNGSPGAPGSGVYGPEGEWLIEGHGVEPDLEVDNLPNSTFNGSDAQLDAAVEYLLQKIEEEPRDIPPVPAFPDKSFKNNRKN